MKFPHRNAAKLYHFNNKSVKNSTENNLVTRLFLRLAKLFIRTEFGYLDADQNNKLRIDKTVPMKPKHEFIVHYNEDLTRLSLYSPSLDRFMNCGTYNGVNSDVNGAFVFDAPTADKDETEFEVQFDESTSSVTLHYSKHHWLLRGSILIRRDVGTYSSSPSLNFISNVDADHRDPLKFFFEQVATEER